MRKFKFGTSVGVRLGVMVIGAGVLVLVVGVPVAVLVGVLLGVAVTVRVGVLLAVGVAVPPLPAKPISYKLGKLPVSNNIFSKRQALG